MIDKSEEPVSEHLRLLRRDMGGSFARLEGAVRDLAEQQRAMNPHIVGLIQYENWATTKFAELETRIERIEQKLEKDGD